MAVTTERRGEVLVIHLDDGRANAVTFDVLSDVTAAMRAAESDPQVKAVVLAGREGCLSAGFDLGVMRGGDQQAILDLAAGGAMLVHTLYGSGVPIVVACTGHAVAMGALLLLAGDVRIGADGDFKIGMNELAIGMVLPDWILTILSERLDRRRLPAAIATAQLYDPVGAVELGFLDEVVPADQVLNRAVAVADRLAATISVRAYARSMATLRSTMLATLESQASAFRAGATLA